MKIIFITIAYPRYSSESNLYSDLMEEFVENGHEVYVVCSIEKRYGKESFLTESNGIKVLRVKTDNITYNSNYIAKGIALLKFQTQIIMGIKESFPDVLFDLVIYSTPPIQYNRIIRYLKVRSNASTYLLLKDIFPQNALDLGLLSKWNPIYWYFKRKEKKTYMLSDRIGCMSPANVNYLLKHNSYIKPEKVEVCPNSFKDRGFIIDGDSANIRENIRTSLSIEKQDLLLIYGGNLGISQGLTFLIDIIEAYKNNPVVKILIVGDGTWYDKISKFVTTSNYSNVILQQRVSPIEFKKMLIAADIGLIFLNPKFTIPNFPSRLTSYLEVGLPVIACTDTATDIGDIIVDAECGFKIISGDINAFKNSVSIFENDLNLQKRYQDNARILFAEKYTTKNAYSTIVDGLVEWV